MHVILLTQVHRKVGVLVSFELQSSRCPSQAVGDKYGALCCQPAAAATFESPLDVYAATWLLNKPHCCC